ncbi:UNVERIFIED_CONTAM: hypothetical protein FKN15_060535 [Acipenser sinensis]
MGGCYSNNVFSFKPFCLYGEGYVRYEFPRPQEHIVFLHGQEDGTLYVGGQNKLFNINFKSLNQSTVGRCDVTVLHRYDDSHLFVCGSDGESPQCYMMTDTWNSSEKVNPAGISPFSTNEKAPSLFVEGELYSTSRLHKEGNGKDLRRSWGVKKKVWMHDKSKKDPKYIGITSVSRKEDPLNDKIYTFFQEKNPDTSPDADPWISRVAQVCKVDQGGSRSILHCMWTSFLKARLACGVPSENMFYNRLEEVYVLHAENWMDSRVYGVFSSAWNMTAVCIYSMEEIDSVFTHSKFQGYSGVIPNPRPGTCVDNSQALKDNVLNMAKDHPEMSDWIHPIVKAAPFMISDRHYRKIQVDRVTVPGQKPHNVLLLATGECPLRREQRGSVLHGAQAGVCRAEGICVTRCSGWGLQSGGDLCYMVLRLGSEESAEQRGSVLHGAEAGGLQSGGDLCYTVLRLGVCRADGICVTRCSGWGSAERTGSVLHGAPAGGLQSGRDLCYTVLRLGVCRADGICVTRCSGWGSAERTGSVLHGAPAGGLQSGRDLCYTVLRLGVCRADGICVTRCSGWGSAERRGSVLHGAPAGGLQSGGDLCYTVLRLGSAERRGSVLHGAQAGVCRAEGICVTRCSGWGLQSGGDLCYTVLRLGVCRAEGICVTRCSGWGLQSGGDLCYTVLRLGCEESAERRGSVLHGAQAGVGRAEGICVTRCSGWGSAERTGSVLHGALAGGLQSRGDLCYTVLRLGVCRAEGICVTRCSGWGSAERRGSVLHGAQAGESGLIHKVLEVNHSPFIIAEIHPFKSESHIQSMILDSTTKKLYVGSHYEVVAIDLQNCEQYGDGCEQCILSRDPYCGWSNNKCAKAERGAVQHVEDGDHSQCTQIPKFEHYRSQRGNPEDQELKSIAPLSAPYFLTCPMTSHHASHFWHHNNRTIDCQFSKSDCLHLIEGMKPDLYGKYQCFAEEKGYQQLVTEYTLVPSSGITELSSKMQVLGSVILLVGLIL